MVREYGRTINRSPDPRESEPVLYVYPDGVYTKTQKRQRIDRIFRGWDAVKSDPVRQEDPGVSPQLLYDEAEKRDFYHDADDKENRTYKVSFDNPGQGDTILVSRPAPEKNGAGKKRGGLFGSAGDRNRKDLKDVREKATSRRKLIVHRRGLFLTLLIAAFVIVLLALIYKFFFVVRSIRVEGASRYTAEEIIEASGVRYGANLYSFRSSTAGNNVTLRCPYVEEVDLHRVIPNGVVMTVAEGVPKYCAEIFGETKILSEGLRVLGTLGENEETPEGLIRLKLPTVMYSVEGRLIEFKTQREERVVRDLLGALSKSPLADRANSVDLRSEFNIKIVSDSKYLLELGDSSDAELKLNTAAKVLEDEMFDSGMGAKLDLTHIEKTSVIVDNSLDLE